MNKTDFQPGKYKDKDSVKTGVARYQHIPSECIKTFEFGGQQYEADQILDLMDSTGLDEKKAVLTLYSTVPKASLQPLVNKMHKLAYYVARKDVSLAILNEKGPQLQQNLLDIALKGQYETNRLDATKDALNRIYGNGEDAAGAKAVLVFNFSFNGSGAAAKVHDRIIEGEVIDDIPFGS